MNGVEFSQGEGFVQAIITDLDCVAAWNKRTGRNDEVVKCQQTGIPMDKFKELVFEQMKKDQLK